MLNKQTRNGRPVQEWGLVITLLICFITRSLPAADIHLPSLKIGTDVFTNVTVYQMTKTDIFVRHERGFGNAKISNLDDTTLVLLGLKTVKTVEKTGTTGTTNAAIVVAMDKLKAGLAAKELDLPPQAAAALEAISRFKPTAQLLYGILAGMVLGYLFICLCLKKVCENAGTNPGALVWLPLLQIFPLLRAARIPAWWFVVCFIPLLNLFVHVLWSIRIAKACGKGGLVTLFLLLPGTNILALLYLAFAVGKDRPMERVMKPEDLPGLAGA